MLFFVRLEIILKFVPLLFFFLCFVLYQAGKSFLLIFMLTEVITVSKLAFVLLVFFS